MAQDLADVLRLLRCTARDVRERTDRFRAAVDAYLDHAFSAKDGAALTAGWIRDRHAGDRSAWLRWIAACHAGRGFDHAAPAVEGAWRRSGRLPMTPEVLLPQAYRLCEDPGLTVVRAAPGRLFEAVSRL